MLGQQAPLTNSVITPAPKNLVNALQSLSDIISSVIKTIRILSVTLINFALSINNILLVAIWDICQII